MYQGLVVDVLVGFGGLGFAIEYQAPAEGSGVQNVHSLIQGFARVDNVVDAVKHHQVGRYNLEVPFAGRLHVSQVS